jgi:hypothetical protein
MRCSVIWPDVSGVPAACNYTVGTILSTHNNGISTINARQIINLLEGEIKVVQEVNGIKNNSCGPGSSVGIATGYGLDGPGIKSRWRQDFPALPDRPWGPPSLLYNGYWVFPGGTLRPERAADPSPPSSAEVLEE